MARLTSYALVFAALALSKLAIASPVVFLRRQTTVPSNVANGTVIDGCTAFATAQAGDSCLTFEENNNVSDAQFRALNPEINAGCTNLFADEAYCVAGNATSGGSGGSGVTVPSNVAPGTTINGCLRFQTIVAGDTCDSVAQENGLSFAQLQQINPELNSACTDLILGDAYCVESNVGFSSSTPPSNVANGTLVNECSFFFSVPAGTTCQIVEQEFNITSALFLALNPEINADCDNLEAGDAYCVAQKTV